MTQDATARLQDSLPLPAGARVSVVIPCYRDADTLARALRSLRDQTRPPDEVIVVDDCSPEGERIREIVVGFPGTRYLRNESNLGLAGTRNRGLEQASGEVTAFLDADDESHPQRIEWQLQQVAPGVAVACDTVRVAPGARVPAGPAERFTMPQDVVLYREVGRLIYANRLTGASLMAPTALLRAVGGYDATLRSCEDFDLWLRLLSSGALVRRIRQPLYVYHQNPHGLSRRYAEIARWELAVVGKFLASGGAGPPDGFRAGTVWTTWLLRHLLRAYSRSDAALLAQAKSELARLAPWPVLRWAAGALASSPRLGAMLGRFAHRPD